MPRVIEYAFTLADERINPANGQVGRELPIAEVGRKLLTWSADGGEYRMEFKAGADGVWEQLAQVMTGQGTFSTEAIALTTSPNAQWPIAVHSIRVRTVTAGTNPRADFIGHTVE